MAANGLNPFSGTTTLGSDSRSFPSSEGVQAGIRKMPPDHEGQGASSSRIDPLVSARGTQEDHQSSSTSARA